MLCRETIVSIICNDLLYIFSSEELEESVEKIDRAMPNSR